MSFVFEELQNGFESQFTYTFIATLLILFLFWKCYYQLEPDSILHQMV